MTEKLTEEERMTAIRYIMDPQGEELPKALAEAIKRAHQNVRKNKGDAESETFVTRHTLAAFVNDLTSEERVPILNLLLNKGGPSLMAHADYPLNITRGILEYKEGSQEEKLLTAGLRSIPDEKDYQRSVVLAYLISISTEEQSGIKAIFEAFTAVGIKLGQIASIFWQENGISQSAIDELKELKDHARPLTLAEVYRLMDETLTPEEAAHIKRPVKVLGSASLRTAVLVELTDGREVVMLMQRPHAKEQIESNLTRIERLIPELKKEGFSNEVDVIEAFTEPVGDKMRDELRMSREAAVLKQAKTFYERMNEELKEHLGGWRFVVPELVDGFQVRDTMLFTTYVGQGSFHALPEGPEKNGMGQAIVTAGIKTFFEEGFMNTDPHAGNYLVDGAAKMIGVIDWGQTEYFTEEDRYNLTQFLLGVAMQDSAMVLEYGGKMRNGGRLDSGFSARGASPPLLELWKAGGDPPPAGAGMTSCKKYLQIMPIWRDG